MGINEGGKRWTSRGSATAPSPSSTSPSRKPLPRAGTASALMHPRCPNCYLRKQKSPSCPLLFFARKLTEFSPFVVHVACLQQVGQGLSRDGKALKLAFQHWIEAVSTNRTNPTIVLFVNLVDLVRCFHVCEKGLLSVSADLRVLVMCEH